MKESKNPKIVRCPISFTFEDCEHCLHCWDFVRYLIDTNTDGLESTISLTDLDYLERLLCREANVMMTVMEAAGGSDNVI